MRRRNAAVATLLATALGLIALPSCGAEESHRAGTSADAAPGPSPRRDGGVALQRIGRFASPVYVAAAPGFPNLLFVVERAGKVVVLRDGRRLRHPFLDIERRVSTGGERGLLSIAFPPDYRRSGRFYVFYTDPTGDIRVDELKRRSPTRAAPGSRRPVIRIRHRANTNHNGGQLQFLGRLLYFGTGDGGSAGDPPNNAQNKSSLLGKLLRIDPRASHGRPYTVPRQNPFVGKPGRDEIYSYGLRNPFRFSFDPRRKRPRILIADVGQSRFEELDYATLARARGANFGWDAFEGFSRYSGLFSGTRDPGGTVKPVFAYSHARGGSCSIIGGYIARDPRLPGLRGRYVYADLCEGELRALAPRLGRARGDRKLGISVSTPSSFGEDSRGRIYVCSLDGPVYRLVPR